MSKLPTPPLITHKEPDMTDDLKTCPYCTENIRTAATVCKHCGCAQPGAKGAPSHRKVARLTSVWSIFPFVLSIAALGLLVLPFVSLQNPKIEIEDIIYATLGVSILVLSLTLSGALIGWAMRTLRSPTKSSFTSGRAEWLMGALGGSIALFGILITGVFVITTFRVASDARSIAEQAAPNTILEYMDDEGRIIISQVTEELFNAGQDSWANDSLAISSLIGRLRNTNGNLGNGQTRLVVGTETRHQISEGGEFYKLDIGQNDRYRIDVMGVGNFDPIIALAFFEGTVLRVIGSNDDGGEDLDSRLEENLIAGRDYVIAIAGYIDTIGEVRVLISNQ